MGYKRKIKTFTLVFEGEEYEGLEINAKSLPMGAFLDVSKRFQSEKQSEEDVEAILATFASSVTSWNLEDDDDKPIPASLDGLKVLDLEFVFAVIAAWLQGISGTTAELGKGSPSGDNSPEASMLMADL